MTPIYLDYNASTPLAPEVAGVMRDAMDSAFGNPSSPHWAGEPAREMVEKARRQVADLLGCAPQEVVFTSGGSEANNFALKGTFLASTRTRRHIVTTRIEHPAIVAPCRFLERLGAEITWLPVDGTGQIDPDDLRRAIGPDTILVSLMHANNEVGTIQPIEDCATIARERGIPFHTDAAQSVGKIPTRVDELGVDLRFTPTPPSRSAKSRRGSMSWASTCSPSPVTSSTRPRGSGRSISATALRWSL
jgi:cysteine desulfurase